MASDRADLIKIGAGLVLTAAVVRYLWKWCSSSGTSSSSSSKPGSTPLLVNGKAGASSNGATGSATSEADIHIYFGSQSGTAEGFANELKEEAAQHDMTAAVIDLEDFEPEEFATNKVVILIVATYGEGDPTDNAVEFFKWLQGDERHPGELNGMKFCVFALGNRQYVNFCSCGKVGDERFEELGGVRIYEKGEGDDDQNIEEDFEQWKENGLWPALRQAVGKVGDDSNEKNTRTTIEDVIGSLQLKAEIKESKTALPVDPLVQIGGSDVLGKWYFQAHQSQVVQEYELRQVADPASGKTTKHIDFDVKSIPSLDWRTADNLEVLPSNPSDVVEWWAQRLDVSDSLGSFVGFKREEGVSRPVKKPFPTPSTVEDALTLYCDLCQAPTKNQLKKFAVFLTDEEERDTLEALLEDRHVYHWLTGDGVRITFREVFELFLSSAKIDIGTFLQLVPRQRSRPYTIASSSREDRHTIGLCVGVVAEELKPMSKIVTELKSKGHAAPGASALLATLGSEASTPRQFRGVCSTMLCTRTKKSDRLWIQAKPSTFRLPRKSSAPVIMIGAGTGVAPFRAFVREFRAENGLRPKTILFFGCQKSDTDFLYKDEFTEALSTTPKALGELVTAFSREQEHKVYVQHKIKERAADIAAMVRDGGYIFVCGATAMGASIRSEVAAALGSQDYVSRMVTEGRFVEELW